MRTARSSFRSCLSGFGALDTAHAALSLARGLFDDQVAARKIHGVRFPRLGGWQLPRAYYIPLLALLLPASSVGGMFSTERCPKP